MAGITTVRGVVIGVGAVGGVKVLIPDISENGRLIAFCCGGKKVEKAFGTGRAGAGGGEGGQVGTEVFLDG